MRKIPPNNEELEFFASIGRAGKNFLALYRCEVCERFLSRERCGEVQLELRCTVEDRLAGRRECLKQWRPRLKSTRRTVTAVTRGL